MNTLVDEYSAAESYYERLDQQYRSLLSEWSAGAKTVTVPVVPKPRLKRIWLDFGRSGVVRDEKGMDWIASQMLTLITRLVAATQFQGHDSFDPMKTDEELKERWPTAGMDNESFMDYLTIGGGYYLTDRVDRLPAFYDAIFRAESAEQQLYAVDKLLNFVHQRSDLAAWFVEGGTSTLNEIASQGGYVAP